MMLKLTGAVVALAIFLQYAGVILGTAPAGGAGGTGSGTVNTSKLIADLNGGMYQSTDGAGDEGLQQAASAALSLLYLASIPGLRDQVKAPGVLEALARRVLAADLVEAREEVLQQQQRRHSDGGAELLSAGLLALAKVAAGDEAFQEQLMGRAKRRGNMLLAEGQLLARMHEMMNSGIPTWQAAAAVLLYTLAGDQLQKPSVLAWVALHADQLMDTGIALVETAWERLAEGPCAAVALGTVTISPWPELPATAQLRAAPLPP
ncbi:hypothetical protein TSOC_009893 [Tetrabaena socialis]|uniref:Uncharacterized protein n=1 Tax=Tetrabaena socialis TaxID=47790 RepID=A0A2J7ZUP6_9CHLO|nr:hypothetical protein TSOC_009893 [Tetrabaena socialis]|eukprot:PNH03996.1 hypothetical protein TSOC_009893 [Tetrabaena socialis]